MKVISVNAGVSKTLTWKNQEFVTSIYKQPVQGRVAVSSMGIEPDTQSDLRVHGGIYKAVYVYPSEHYAFWESELPDFDFQWGTFGENLSVAGLLETEVCLGDEYQIGSALFKVTQPRFPCSKLGMRFDDSMMVKRFLESRRSGFYLSVTEAGELESGDSIKLINKKHQTSVHSFVDVYASKTPDKNVVQGILNDPELIDEWKDFFETKLKQQQ